MLGSVLPWSVMTTGDRVHSAAGTAGDGRVTLLLGLILVAAGVLTLLGVAARWLAITAISCAIMLTVIAAYDAVDLSAFGNAGDELASLEMGHGLVITVIGGVLAAVGRGPLRRPIGHRRPLVGPRERLAGGRHRR